MSLSINNNLEIIQNYPLFKSLTADEVNELSQLFKEQTVPPNTIIVNEGDPVDSIYLIVSGAAEVSRKVISKEENKIYNVATLARGDAIGLTQEGFFSETGLRMGTVIAALPMKLLVITLEDFYHFLQKSKHLTQIKEACENIFLMNFIKESHLFSHLNKEQIQTLKKEKRKIDVPAGKVIFKEGEKADKFYFILSGKVAIKTKNHHLATLGTSKIFGEGAFISGEKHNADAIAETNCELFVLDSKQIQFVNSAIDKNIIAERRMSQLRPMPRPHISIIEEKTSENTIIRKLLNPINQSKLVISDTDYIIWQHLDGHTALLTILENNSQALKNITLQEMYRRVVEMANAGFLDLKKKTFLDELIEKIRLAW